MNIYDYKLVVAVTGGGSLFISNRLMEGGASAYLLEANVPYAQAALDKYVGGVREKYCSGSTARQMAVASYRRGRELGESKVIGIGCSCSLRKPDGEREGREHAIFIAFVSGQYVVEVKWSDKNIAAEYLANTRMAEEVFAAGLIKRGAELFASGLDSMSHINPIPFSHLFSAWNCAETGHSVTVPTDRVTEILYSLTGGTSMTLRHEGFKSYDNFYADDAPIVVYPGSFNPWHEGHQEVYDKLVELFGENRVFTELSVENYDKPPIDAIELENRFKGLGPGKNTLVTRAVKFIDKYKAVRYQRSKVVFAVGADTLDRIDMNDFAGLVNGEVKFLAFPRNGKTIRHFNVPPWLVDERSYDLKREINISSTEIRKNRKE